ncbi:hypothetical protein ACEI30_004516 [Vibrio parahaemolyticus]
MGIQTVLLKLISLVGAILFIPLIFLLILSIGYIVTLASGDAHAANELKTLTIDIWKAVVPVADKSLSIVSPILVLLIVGTVISWFKPNNSINLGVLTENLPSILAIFVLGSLCILPLMGEEIPNELGNIALVVVGFYFGKLHNHTDKT